MANVWISNPSESCLTVLKFTAKSYTKQANEISTALRLYFIFYTEEKKTNKKIEL